MATLHDSDPFQLDLGPGEITYGGVVMGKTATNTEGGTHGGVITRYELLTEETYRDAEGANPHDEIVTGQKLTVEANLAGLSIEQLSSIFPSVTVVGSGTSRKLQITNPVGKSMRGNAQVLIIKPIIEGVVSTDQTDWMVFPIAYLKPAFELPKDLSTQLTYKVNFTIFHNTTTGVLAEWSHSGT